jgi:hypothetical protein
VRPRCEFIRLWGCGDENPPRAEPAGPMACLRQRGGPRALWVGAVGRRNGCRAVARPHRLAAHSLHCRRYANDFCSPGGWLDHIGVDIAPARLPNRAAAANSAVTAAQGSAGDLAELGPRARSPQSQPRCRCTRSKSIARSPLFQARYPADRLEETVAEIGALFPDELMLHLEFQRGGGRVTAGSLPLIRYTTRQRLVETIDANEAHGVLVANPLVSTLEDNGRYKRAETELANALSCFTKLVSSATRRCSRLPACPVQL